MTRFQKTYYLIFIFSAIICWSPYEEIAYILPFIVLCILCISSNTVFLRLSVLFFIFLAWVLIGIITGGFVVQNVFLGFLTWSAAYVVLVVPSRFLNSIDLYQKIMKISLLTIFAQSIIGMFQLFFRFMDIKSFDVAAGDVVEGTIHLALSNGTGFESKIYALNLVVAILCAFPMIFINRKRNLRIIACILMGLLAFVLASVVHLILSFALALGITWIIIASKNPKRGLNVTLFTIATIIFGFMIVSKLMPTNSRLILNHLQTWVYNPKILLITDLLNIFRRNLLLLMFGVGPGQGVSRAALISAGGFIRGADSLPFLQQRITFVLRRVLNLFTRYWNINSAIRPASSWIAFFSEFGVMGILVVVGLFLGFLWRIRRNMRHTSIAISFSGVAIASFIIISGFWEYYFEVPQAILLGILSLKVISARIAYNSPQFTRDFIS